MIVFIGDKPSKKNIDPEVPFVGTQSYKRLLEWIWEMDIDISEVKMINSTTQFAPWIVQQKENKIIILGNNAEKFVKKCTNKETFKLPHPSGLNRKLNDKKWLKKELNRCKIWLRGRDGQ